MVDSIEEKKRWIDNASYEELLRNRQRDCGEILLDTPRTTWFDRVHLSLARDRFGSYKGYYMPELTPTERLVLELKTNGNHSNIA